MSQSKISFSRAIDGGVKISKDEVFGVYNLLNNIFNSAPEVTLALSDGIEIKSQNIEEIFADAALKSNKIEEIGISVYDFPNSRHGNFKIKNETFKPLNYGCTGSKSDCDQFRQRMHDEIESMLTWYSFLYRFEIFSWVMAAIVIGVPIFLYNVKNVKSESFAVILLVTSLSNGIFISAVIRKFIFPRVIFDIGKSGKINEFRVRTVKFIFYGVFLTIILGVIGNYVTNKII